MPYALTLQQIHTALQEPANGSRVLIDRLWPRGLRKDSLGDITWYRDASPETALRQGLHQGSLTIEQFRDAYRRQLDNDPGSLQPLLQLARQGPLELLTATHEPQTSYLVVLRQALCDALAATDQDAPALRTPASSTPAR